MSSERITFMAVGFSPSSAIMAWRLSLAKSADVFTYWPTNEVHIESDLYEPENQSHSVFHPHQLDLHSLPPGTPAMDYVLLSIPSIKDVARMCKKIAPVISKKTTVLVDVSGGHGTLQNLVRAQLKCTVAAIMCDVNVEIISQVQPIFYLKQYGTQQSPGPAPVVHLEPVVPKAFSSLCKALQSGGLPASMPKTVASFLAVQFERSIGVVAFELLPVALEIPFVEDLVTSVVAKPVLQGLIAEMLQIGQAAGAKGLPTAHALINASSSLIRRAPANFEKPKVGRLFYEYYKRTPLQLDFLLLLPILLSDDLSRSGPTPYLESLYATMSHMSALNNGPMMLLQRVNEPSSTKTVQEVDTKMVAKVEAQTKEIEMLKSQLAARDDQFAARQRELEGHRDREIQRSSALDLEIAEKNAALAAASKREMALNEREQMLASREQAVEAKLHDINQRERQRLSTSSVQTPQQVQPQQPQQQFQQQPQQQFQQQPQQQFQQQPQQPQQPQLQQQPQQPQQGVYQPRQVNPNVRYSNSAPQLPGAHMQMHNTLGPNANRGAPRPQSQQQRFMPPNSSMDQLSINGLPRGAARTRRSSTNIAAMNAANAASGNYDPYGGGIPMGGSRRRQSMKSPSMTSMSNYGNGGFSQTMQLDSLLGSTNDRFGSVSRASKGPMSVQQQLTADHSFGSNRPFAHGPSMQMNHNQHMANVRRASMNSMQQHQQPHQQMQMLPPGVGHGANAVQTPRGHESLPTFEVTEFANFSYDREQGEQGSGSASGNSRSTPPRSNSATPPTPNGLDASSTSKLGMHVRTADVPTYSIQA